MFATPEPTRRFRIIQWTACILVVLFVLSLIVFWIDWSDLINWGNAFKIVAIGIVDLIAAWLILWILFCAGRTRRALFDMRKFPSDAESYLAHDLGPVTDDAGGRELYLDLMKRAVTNLLYEDIPMCFFDGDGDPVIARGFDLTHRVNGEDGGMNAHTMIGVRRIENLRHGIETVLEEGVPGDFIETGSYLGGATIFMRAVLKAHEITDRRIFVCDTFAPPIRKTPRWLNPILAALASIPDPEWRRKFYTFLHNRPNQRKNFPPCHRPSEKWINLAMWSLRYPVVRADGVHNSLELVKSHFARYGLLDDQVEFVQGFFADTLPQIPAKKFAIIRLDGDTYESTRDGIEPLYGRLSPGGFCIVDDYHAFPDCREAIDDFRKKHGVAEEMIPIDNHAVYWRKT